MKLFILFLLASTTYGFGSNHGPSPENEDSVILEILANGKSAVLADAGDRLYLDPEKLHTTREGIFLELDHEHAIILPTLYSDFSGCFVKYHSTKVTKKCPHCGEQRLSGAFKCPNPNCLSNQ